MTALLGFGRPYRTAPAVPDDTDTTFINNLT